MQSFKRPTLAEAVSEIEELGWQRSHKQSKKPPFSYHHPNHPRHVAIVQQMPSGRVFVDFLPNF